MVKKMRILRVVALFALVAGLAGCTTSKFKTYNGPEVTRLEVLGLLPSHETVTGFDVTPVVALVKNSFVPRPEAGEVDEVFDVPLSHVMNPALFQIQSRRWRGTQRRYYTVPFGPYYIWGATARILRAMADAANQV